MKKILIAACVLLGIMLIILVIALTNLGPILKKAVNTYGPRITKTDVTLDDVGVSLFKGRAALEDFSVGNPAGFQQPAALHVEAIELDLDEASILQNPVVIDLINVKSPEIHYEFKGKTDNLRELLRNVKESMGPADPADETGKSPKDKKRIFIKDFFLTNATLVFSSTHLEGQAARVSLPDIHLEDVGGKGEGSVPAQVMAVILEKIYEAVRSGAVRGALEQKLDEFGRDLDELLQDGERRLEGLQEKLETEPGKVGDKVSDKLKEFLGN